MHVNDERRRRPGSDPEESVLATAPVTAAARVLALQRGAGNARVAAYLQRAAVGWKPDAIAINAGSKASGGFTRFPIGDLSTGLAETEDIKKLEKGTKGWKSATEHTSEHPFKRSVVLVPTDLLAAPPAEIDVLFHLHGHGIGYREGIKDADDKSAPVGFAYKGKVRDEVADNIAGQIPTTMAAVLPQGTRTSGFGSVAPQAMILEALQTVPGWGAVKPRRVMLGAYSGGGGSMPGLLAGGGKGKRDDRIAERQKLVPGLSEVALFDAINGPGELGAIVSFVSDQIEADIVALSALDDPKQRTYLQSSMRFRGFFSAGSPSYGPLYAELFEKTVQAKGLWRGVPASAKPGKVPGRLAAKIAQDVWETLAANYVIAPRGQGHPTKVGGGNLKEAADALTPGAAPTY